MTVARLVLAAAFLTAAAHAETTLPHLFSDHAVLQRDRPIHVWGWDTPKQTITVTLHNHSATTAADASGRWQLWLKPESAGGPYELSAKGSSTAIIRDILVGDVWLASGQSNMQMPLSGFGPGSDVTGGKEAIAAAKPTDTIRLLHIELRASSIPQAEIKATWTQTNATAAADFSAVAYFFGRELAQREHVPIGLIDSTWGGTPIEAWMSLEGISQDTALMPLFASRATFADEQIEVARTIADEKQEDAEALAAGKPKPTHPWHPNADSWIPAALYDGMIAPLTGYAIKGALWYQGESNADPDRAPLYAKLMPALIADWRARWAEGDFPFFFVQLAGWQKGESWGIIRDAQRRTLSVINTGMAVALDIGDEKNIHPANKPEVAARLALAARHTAYGEDVEFTGPLYRQTTIEGPTLRLWFDHATGLHARGNTVLGFEIAGDDNKFVPAAATLDGETVLVTSPDVAHPRHVRYGWAGLSPANLYNQAELPAPTFATE